MLFFHHRAHGVLHVLHRQNGAFHHIRYCLVGVHSHRGNGIIDFKWRIELNRRKVTLLAPLFYCSFCDSSFPSAIPQLWEEDENTPSLFWEGVRNIVLLISLPEIVQLLVEGSCGKILQKINKMP